MTLNLNYLYGDGIEVFLDSLQTVGMTCSREIITYNSKTQKAAKSFGRYVSPTTYRMEGKISSDDVDVRRKLEYLNTVDTNVLMVLGSENDALYGIIKNLTTERIKNGVSRVAVDVQASGRAISDMVSEAEDAMYYGDPVEVDDSDASGGTAIELDAQNDMVYFEETQSSYRLPLGDYKVFVRAKDTAQVADDLNIEMYNTSDSTSVGSTTKTLTAEYALYESGTITIASDDVGDTIRIIAEKATATTNIISIDFIGFARV